MRLDKNWIKRLGAGAVFGLIACGLARAAALPVTAQLEKDQITIRVGGKLFTRYLFGPKEKYPHFYPVIGPLSGRSVTVRGAQPYPHHRSLFLGCDRVNGGNYWQQGLERGQIVAVETRLARKGDRAAVIEQRCRWQRPGQRPVFDDQRRITISAPAPDLRALDFEFVLTALQPARILRSNHAWFAARMAPDLAVKGGGHLVNAEGADGEKATFGKRSPWMDAWGRRPEGVEGLAILTHPDNPWHPCTWFTRDYGFFSPSPMYWLPGGELRLDTGKSLRLKYRVIVHGGKLTKEAIQALLARWTAKEGEPGGKR